MYMYIRVCVCVWVQYISSCCGGWLENVKEIKNRIKKGVLIEFYN